MTTREYNLKALSHTLTRPLSPHKRTPRARAALAHTHIGRAQCECSRRPFPAAAKAASISPSVRLPPRLSVGAGLWQRRQPPPPQQADGGKSLRLRPPAYPLGARVDEELE